jgi:hypothetical protein
MTKSRGDKKPQGSNYQKRDANNGGNRGRASTNVDASTLLQGTVSGTVPGGVVMPSVAAMLGTTTPTPNAQMLQALLTASLAGQQQQVSDATYQIKCSATEYAQLQAATLAQRTNAEQAQAKTMAVQIAKVVQETVDARYVEEQKTLKQLKPQYLPDPGDKSSSTEVGSPEKLTPRKRSRANKKQRMASQLIEQQRKIADLQSRLEDEEKADKTASRRPGDTGYFSDNDVGKGSPLHITRSTLKALMAAAGDEQQTKKSKTKKAVKKAISFDEEEQVDLDSEAEDDARVAAIDLSSPGTSSAYSCADLIAVVKKQESGVTTKSKLSPLKFAEAVLKSLAGALQQVKGVECPSTIPKEPKQLEMQLKAKAALFLSVIDRANKATRQKKETAAGANKQYTVQLFEGLLSDTFGIHKKNRETQLAWMSRTLYHLIRENVDLEQDAYLRQVWNSDA